MRLIFVAALALGVLGDLLFRTPVWGLNLTLWIGALALGRHALTSDRIREPRWPWLAAVFFAAMWLFRDSEMLLAVDLLALLGLLSLPLVVRAGQGLLPSGAAEIIAGPFRSVWHAGIGAGGALLAWNPLPAVTRSGFQRSGAIGLGLVFAVPLVLIFGALFASADPVFAKAVESIMQLDLIPALQHVVVIGLLSWAVAGYLWGVVGTGPGRPVPLPAMRLGFMPVAVPLAATGGLFLLFIAAQAGTLFGGEAFIRSQAGLSIADYARRGFFQMLLASALSLPLVYVAAFVAGTLTPRQFRLLRIGLGAQLALTSLVLASALWRLGLYVRMYGLTEDRLYGLTFLGWLGATIAVFGVTVLRGRPRGAATATVIAATLSLAALNLVNPEAFIARYNLSHEKRGGPDTIHLVRMGGDAVPVLVTWLDRLPGADRCELTAQLIDRYGDREGDWRGWNLARQRARAAVAGLRRCSAVSGQAAAVSGQGSAISDQPSAVGSGESNSSRP
ncbi:MAG TPA: DUF4173 domain-containing protein [Gemmatimonadales bacterium]|nr:DUF4173 domain-containing protein [Gemmatimonadales bacterium]